MYKSSCHDVSFVMKRFAKMVFVFLLSLPWIANAVESPQNLLPLTNENLIAVLQNSNYRNWEYYQPAARETDANTSSERDMEQRSIGEWRTYATFMKI